MQHSSLFALLATSTALASLARAQTLATYDAGSAGNPMTAPDPTTQGWTLTDPSGGQVVLADVSPDGTTGLNAWRVEDNVTFNGGRAHYGALFSGQELADAVTLGFELEMSMRIVADAGLDCFMEFATGTSGADDRYLSFFTTAGSDVVVTDLFTGNTITCPGGNDGEFHTYTTRKDAGVLDADFLYDGAVVGQVLRAASNGNAPAGGVHWGLGLLGRHDDRTLPRRLVQGRARHRDPLLRVDDQLDRRRLDDLGQRHLEHRRERPRPDRGSTCPTASPGSSSRAPRRPRSRSSTASCCVAPTGLQRFANVASPSGNAITETVDTATSAPGGLNVAAGMSYFYQRWNRDPAAGGGFANFSNGVEIAYVP